MSGDYIVETGDDGVARVAFRGDEGGPIYYLAWIEREVASDPSRGIHIDRGIAGTWWTPIRRRAWAMAASDADELVRYMGDKYFYHHVRL